MQEMQIFNNPEFGDVRTLTIDGEPWFIGSDIAKALGYAKPQNAITTHCRHALKRGIGVQTGNKADGTPSIQNIEMLIIPEGDMYRLISKSKLKSAERFEEWVFDEVLPSIRKTGAYGHPQFPTTIPGQIQLLAQGHVALEAKIDSVREDLEKFKNDMPILGVEESKITTAVRKKGVECLGGKESPAYNDKSLRSRLYSDLHRQLRRQFGVSSYKAIKRNQTDIAVDIIRCYAPPLVLAETIETVNAQMEMEGLEG